MSFDGAELQEILEIKSFPSNTIRPPVVKRKRYPNGK